jgi:flavodoxin
MTDEVKHARELFTRLSAGDTAGYGGAEFMANEIRANLKKAGADSASLDPSGKNSVADMDRALNAATSALQVKHSRELYTRLSVGDTAGYGGAEFMANEIRANLKKAGADSASLDPSGKKSAADMDRALNAATLQAPAPKFNL